MRKILPCLLLLCLASATIIQAQTTTGDILGTVTDANGAVVIQATVVVENTGTHITRTTKTSNSGDYDVTLLNPGVYSVKISAPGFKTYTVSNIQLSAGDRIRTNAALAIGQVSQTVTVQSTASALQTDSAVVSSTISEHQTQDLPLNGRNYVQLVQLQPGVNEGNQGGLVSGADLDDHRQSAEMSVNGQSDVLNNQMIDGADNNERLIGTVGVRPSVESIAEMQIQTSDYSADVSRTGGGVVNIITKSGTNTFHGSLFEYLRNDIFDAYSYDFGQNLPKNEYRWNQFGGSLSGPILHNKAFFFGDYEGYREVQGSSPQQIEVPSAFEHNNPGNFSDNPSMTPTFGKGPIDPAGLGYFELLPLPNSTLKNGDPAFTGISKNQQYSNDFDTRVDYSFNQNNTAYGRFIYNHVFSVNPGFLPTAPLVGTSLKSVNPNVDSYNSLDLDYNGMVNYDHIFTPNLVLELKGSYTFDHNDSFGQNTGLNPNTALGQPNIDTPLDNGTALQSIVIAGAGDTLGDMLFEPLVDQDNTFQYMGTVTYTHGPHTLKFGASLIRRQSTSVQSAIAGGLPIFLSYPDLLQGQYVTMGIPRAQELDAPHLRSWETGFYAEDDWHVNQHLTLNLGLRYDVYTPYTEIANRISTWDPYNETLLIADASAASPTTGVVAASPTAGVMTDYRDGIEPRFGFDWLVSHGTVVRGGFGISSDPPNNTSAANMKNTPFVSSVNCSYLTCGLYANGLPPIAAPAKGTELQTPGVTLDAMDPHFHVSYFEQYDLTVQKDIKGNVATLSYVGILGRRGPTDLPDINLPGPNTCGNNTGCQNALRPYSSKYPDLSTVAFFTTRGVSSYNALQADYNRRFIHGLSIDANYTWAHNLGDIGGLTSTGGGGWGLRPNQLRQVDYGNEALDIRNRIAVTGIYALPFGNNLHGWEGALAKGWNYNLIFAWSTGLPYSIVDSNCISGAEPGCSDRTNMTGTPSVSNPSVNQFFNTAAFSAQPAGTFGNEPLNPLHGPHFRHADMSVDKTFNLEGPYQMQFRAEAFNVSNTANFAQPNANLGAPATFGSITALNPGYLQRAFQFALRFSF